MSYGLDPLCLPTSSGFTRDRTMQNLFGARYIDDILMHREDHDGDGDFTDTGSERWWHLTDVQFSTVAIIDDAAVIAERIQYDAYGRAYHHQSNDTDGDGDYDSTDYNAINTAIGTNIDDVGYEPDLDVDRDGSIDDADAGLAGTTYSSALSRGELSNTTVKNTIGWDGYVFNPEHEMYTVRFRWYSPELGRWLERDPLQYVSGMHFSSYADDKPIRYRDPYGLLEDEDEYYNSDDYVVDERTIKLTDECDRQLGWVTYRHVYTDSGQYIKSLPPITNALESWEREMELLDDPETRAYHGDIDACCEIECERATNILLELNEGAACAEGAMEFVLEAGGVTVGLLIPGPFDEMAAAALVGAWALHSARAYRYARRIENCLDEHLTADDLAGTLKDLRGTPVLKNDGTVWQHLNENLETQNALRNIIRQLQRELSTPNLCDRDRELLERLISDASNTLDRAKKPHRIFEGE